MKSPDLDSGSYNTSLYIHFGNTPFKKVPAFHLHYLLYLVIPHEPGNETVCLTYLKCKSAAFRYQSSPKSTIVAHDERARISLVIHCGQVDGIRANLDWLTFWETFCYPVNWINDT